MLLAIDLHEYFVDVEGVTVASVLSLQSPGVSGSELDTPEPDRFSANGDASLGQEVLEIAVTQVEAIVEPDGIGNDIWRESMTLVSIRDPIVSIRSS